MKQKSILLFLLISIRIFSQNPTENSYIDVTGVSETEIAPNEIYIDISMKERNEKGKKLTLDILENRLKNTLKSIGIPENNLTISDVNSVLAKTGWWTEEVLSVAHYRLKIKGADKLKPLFEQFKKMKIYDVNITKATHSNIIEIRKKNRIKAIKKAKEKADYLLFAIGQQTGKPAIINELTNKNPSFVNANFINQNTNYAITKISGSGLKNKFVEFRKIKITSSIYVKFLIQ
ncbi:SIMPL domain-containing protein [Polaribacter sp. R77954]|uniref:SIMPL domain-containing protein n=1 Tax=Polaribacter sp. R77954 TaxID=3093870 RepID=UPI0037CC5B6B